MVKSKSNVVTMPFSSNKNILDRVTTTALGQRIPSRFGKRDEEKSAIKEDSKSLGRSTIVLSINNEEKHVFDDISNNEEDQASLKPALKKSTMPKARFQDILPIKDK